VLHNQNSDETYIPLHRVDPGRVRKFIASNSHLSEYGVLGFEFGYAMANPNTLTLWEA
jgi:2-oxoglutarate dehydrogenase E1 component